ncbi:MAG TPA: Ig-like domain-containing protein, partial [Dermatophilaceae bacterium]|nr:Ig-like domain-containing protein [Dermatophilaceae bacterium]
VPVTVTVSPVNGARSVTVSSNIVAVFNTAVSGVDATSFTLVDTVTGTPVPAVVTYASTTRTAVLNPDANLTADHTYQATLTSAIKSGNDLLAPTTWQFLTGPAPSLIYRWPDVGAKAVEPSTVAQLTFSEPVTGVTSSTFYIQNMSTGAIVPANLISTSSGRLWQVQPLAPIAEDTWHKVVAVGGIAGIRDLAGNPYGGTSWTFLSGWRPFLTSWTPSTGAVGVSTTSPISLGFSEAITGVTAATCYLTDQVTGALVPATISSNAAGTAWTLQPNAPLASARQYRITLIGSTGTATSSIRDLAGNPLASMAWNFTTG